MSDQETAVVDSPEPAKAAKPAPAPEVKAAPRGDPWIEPCPVCGLLGCRRHV